MAFEKGQSMTQRYDDRYSRADGPRREWRERERQREPSQPYGQREPYNPGSSGESRYSESQFGQRRFTRDPLEGPRGEPQFGEGPFADTSESPRLFGMGYYGEGGAHSTGGFDQRGIDYGSQRGDYDYDRHAGQNSPRPEGVVQRAFQRGPKGYQRSDERLREDISERLVRAERIDSSEVTVTVVAAKVTLEGTVPDRYTKHYIEDLADACPGVQDIENRIRVTRR